MHQPSSRIWSMLFVVLLSVCGGCGSSTGPNLVTVSGIVTLDSQPLTGAIVKFFPMDPKLTGSFGVTDTNGKFELLTASNKGAHPGSYKVVIEHFTDPTGKPIAKTEGQDLTQQQLQGQIQQTLPITYSDFMATTLTADVKPQGKNELEFPLKKS